MNGTLYNLPIYIIKGAICAKERKSEFMKIAVCDDDKATREHIVSLIKEQDAGADITVFADGEEMLKSDGDFDISFLDVEMREVSGVDVAKQIRKRQGETGKSKSIIIFVTGYEKYVYDAFDVSAFHYLIKPLNKEKFADVFDRAWKEASAVQEQEKQYLFVKNAGVQKKVYLKDIFYIESANKKVIIHTKMGILETYGKMDEWEKAAGGSFYRCHRCYLVNMENIASYGTDMIETVNGDKLLLAQKKYSDFVKRYMDYAKNGGIVNV